MKMRRGKWGLREQTEIVDNVDKSVQNSIFPKKGKKWDHAIPNRSILNAVFNYAPNKSQDITLSMYNLLNRHNCINENENWDLPFNWILSYRLSF